LPAARCTRRSLAILIGFGCCLRPQEITRLQVGQVVRKDNGEWILILNPEFLGIRSKGRIFDDAVALDGPLLNWLDPFLNVLAT
jgi:hypothetical protein